ncbi:MULTISPECIES: NAD-dependent epimerase/dehydratase family protein [unclassified Jeotgalibaca]|uniref:NAD-dependent epimerase/dehydratase family protein n=1 Tax=unclassified Jeotgalibaca TaxID=2621505 RepID=UPI003FD218A8
MAKILITGANGNIGTVLTEYLKPNHELTLVDVEFTNLSDTLLEGLIYLDIDLVKPENWNDLLTDIEYVIHLAGDPSPEADFYGTLLDLNYKVPHNLFEAAIKSNVKRIIFASSVHAIMGYPKNVQVKTSDYPKPADAYGVSKVYMEALASFHAYTSKQEAIGIRIGGFDSKIEPGVTDMDGLAIYLSKRDMCHLIDCCLEAELAEPFLLVNGVSNNRFPRMDISQAHFDIGYTPKDDAFKMLQDGVLDFKEEDSVDMEPGEE